MGDGFPSRTRVSFPCPCGGEFSHVVDTRRGRKTKRGTIRRRRECSICGLRATSYEEIDQASIGRPDERAFQRELAAAIDRMGVSA